MSPELCVCFQIFLKVILSKREKRAGEGGGVEAEGGWVQRNPDCAVRF